jgi:hypothetical protein
MAVAKKYTRDLEIRVNTSITPGAEAVIGF